jgi:hypothetical protein
MWGLSRGRADCTSDGYFANTGICESFVNAVAMPQVVAMYLSTRISSSERLLHMDDTSYALQGLREQMAKGAGTASGTKLAVT